MYFSNAHKQARYVTWNGNICEAVIVGTKPTVTLSVKPIKVFVHRETSTTLYSPYHSQGHSLKWMFIYKLSSSNDTKSSLSQA